MDYALLRAWEGYPLTHQWGHKQVNDRLYLQWSNRRQLLRQLQQFTTAGLLQHHAGTRRNAVVGTWSITPLALAWLKANPFPLPSDQHTPPHTPLSPQHNLTALAAASTAAAAEELSHQPTIETSPLPPAHAAHGVPAPFPSSPHSQAVPALDDEAKKNEATSPGPPPKPGPVQGHEEEEQNEPVQRCSKCGTHQSLVTFTCRCHPPMCERCFSARLTQHKVTHGLRVKYCCPVCNAHAARRV